LWRSFSVTACFRVPGAGGGWAVMVTRSGAVSRSETRSRRVSWGFAAGSAPSSGSAAFFSDFEDTFVIDHMGT
jgi:hypothetical protein